MNWPEEEWKVGLPPQALRAIAEVEQRLERVQKERQQKQVQLDTLEGIMHKQRQKHEEEKASWAALSQQNRSLAEACEQMERARQRSAQELQAKETQLSCMEAQLGQATRRQAQLEEELRRCQVELEKFQSRSHVVLLPPRWGSPTPWAKGGDEGKADAGKIPTDATREAPCSSSLVGEPCAKEMQTPETFAPIENGEGAPSVAPEPVCTEKELKTLNQELRLALAKAESRIQEKERELWSLQGQLETARLEAAQWKKVHGPGVQVEQAWTQDCRRRRLSEDAGNVRRSREQEKGLSGAQRASSSGSRRSMSSSRVEQLVEKRAASIRQKGLAFLSPKAPMPERSQDELQALRMEVSTLRRRLEASENQRKSLLETCWQQQRTRAWVQERQMPLSALRATSWQKKKDAHGKKTQLFEGREAFVAEKTKGHKKVAEEAPAEEKAELQDLGGDGPQTETPALPAGKAREETPSVAKEEDLNQALAEEESVATLRERMKTLAAAKAEAEAQAKMIQQKFQNLQATLGRQTERLAEALEAQSRHVEELLADAEEQERGMKALSQELEETKEALEAANAEAQRLRGELEEKEAELGRAGSETPVELHREGETVECAESSAQREECKARIEHDGLAEHMQEDKQSQENLEASLDQLLRENQALRDSLARWETLSVGKGDPDTPSVSSGLSGESEAENVPQTAQKETLLWPENRRDVQTQTEGPEAGHRHRRRDRVSVAFDDTQYEPYGLPEVVMKGFADIPSGPSCPYVLRRGILGSAPVAQLAPKAEPEEDGLEEESGAGI